MRSFAFFVVAFFLTIEFPYLFHDITLLFFGQLRIDGKRQGLLRGSFRIWKVPASVAKIRKAILEM